MTIRSLRAGVLAILLGSGAAPVEPANPADADAGGFHVLGRHLYDRCGERVVLRGVNKMIIWTDIDGDPSCAEIARTGANAVRMVWLDMTVDGTYDTLFGWGLEVAVSDEFSIANTAVRPDSMVTGRCRTAQTRPGGGRRVP
jgi:hypothetical protein